MTRTFCDVCDKEIKPQDKAGSIGLRTDKIDPGAEHNFIRTVCIECLNKVENFIENKLRSPLPDETIIVHGQGQHG